jgi:hypothetical protein
MAMAPAAPFRCTTCACYTCGPADTLLSLCYWPPAYHLCTFTLNLPSLQNLVDGLNAKVGAPTYAFVLVPGRNGNGIVGTDAISVKMIYKPATFEPVRTTSQLHTLHQSTTQYFDCMCVDCCHDVLSSNSVDMCAPNCKYLHTGWSHRHP